jgi:hypothetical protein
MDSVDPHLVDQPRAALDTVEGLASVEELRLRWIGHALHAEANITVDPALSVAQGHAIAHHAEARLLTYVQGLTAATIHVSPAGVHRAGTGPESAQGRVRTACAPLQARTHGTASCPTARDRVRRRYSLEGPGVSCAGS